MTKKLAFEDHKHEVRPSRRVSAEVLERTANIFHALGEVSRLKLLELMVEQEWCVSELAAALGEELSAVSHRLKLLRAFGLVSRRREGKHMFYSLRDEHVAELITNALAHASESQKSNNSKK